MRGVVEEKRGLQGKLVPNKEEEISQGRGVICSPWRYGLEIYSIHSMALFLLRYRQLKGVVCSERVER
jgi:hypothetical protein